MDFVRECSNKRDGFWLQLILVFLIMPQHYQRAVIKNKCLIYEYRVQNIPIVRRGEKTDFVDNSVDCSDIGLVQAPVECSWRARSPCTVHSIVQLERCACRRSAASRWLMWRIPRRVPAMSPQSWPSPASTCRYAFYARTTHISQRL